MTQQADLMHAVLHLRAAQRLLRRAFALRPLAVVNKAILITEALISQQQPAQPPLAFEADDRLASD